MRPAQGDASPSWSDGRPGSASAFLQPAEAPDPTRVPGELVRAPSHPQRPEDLLETLIADELEEGLVLGGTAERHVRGPGRGDEPSIQVSRDGSALGSDDPRTDFTRIPVRISREEAANRTPGLCDQERGRHLLREDVEQGASVRAEIGRVESGESIEIVESDRADATSPAGRRGPGPTDHLVLALKSETFVERDRVQIRVQPDGPHPRGAEVIQRRFHHRLPDALPAKFRTHDDGAEEREAVICGRREDAHDAAVRFDDETSIR